VWLRRLGIRFMIGGERTGETFVLVEHLIGPRALAAPMHTQNYEYAHVLEGEVGVEEGEEVLLALPGDLPSSPGACRTPSRTRPMSRHGCWRSSLLLASRVLR
jgi:hypothetical protein